MTILLILGFFQALLERFHFVLEWQNLFFALPMVLALILLGLSLLGSSADNDASVDHDVGDVDHDVDLGEADVHSHTHDFAHDVDHDSPNNILSTMLTALGIGKVPLSILGFCWLMIFGFVGLFLNSIWNGVFGSINILVIVSAAVAFFTSISLTSFLARGIAKIMPQTESHGENLSSFVNREAEVRYRVTSKSGVISLYDKFHNLQTLSAIRDDSCEEDIPSGQKVFILSYSTQDRVFKVIPVNQIINNKI